MVEYPTENYRKMHYDNPKAYLKFRMTSYLYKGNSNNKAELQLSYYDYHLS